MDSIRQTNADNQETGNEEFEVVTAVFMKSSTFWDIMPCSPMKINRPFIVTYYPHFQGRRTSHARNQDEAGSKL
jgi:hypothetical protein